MNSQIQKEAIRLEEIDEDCIISSAIDNKNGTITVEGEINFYHPNGKTYSGFFKKRLRLI